MERTVPIIKLEIEGMKRSICMALSEHSAQMDKDLKNAVDVFCSPENIKRIITETANRVLELVIKDEVTKFFRYGAEGQKAVAAAVKECLLKKETYSPLDEV